MSVGLIVNPKARRASSRGLALAHRMAGARNVHVHVLERFAELDQALARFAQNGVGTIFVSSGDGTVQAVQTAIGERSPFATVPHLALLPHGTTNMNAADVGLRRLGADQVASLMLAPDQIARWPNRKRRHTLRIVNPQGKPPQHGMFLGAGALAHAARQAQTQLNRRGIGGHVAPAMTLVRSLSRFLFAKPAPQDETRIDRPHPMDVFGDGVLKCSGDQLLLLATTLEKLVMNARPFWGGQTAPLRATAITYPPPRVMKHLLPILYGGETISPPEGFVSFSAHRIEVEMASPFLIDGEFFEPPAQGPLVIEAGVEFEYLCG